MLEGIAARIRAAAVAALNDEAEKLAELARSKAPKRKDPRPGHPGGELQKSIEAIEAVQDGEHHWTARVVARAPYARFVEFPTVRTEAQPFLRPAVEESRETFVRNVSASVQAATRQAKAKTVSRKIEIKLKAEES